MSVEQINEYHGKNNSIPLMDSLLMNEQIIKSGMGYDTTKQPLVTDRYDTVNSLGRISVVATKAITMKPHVGFVIPGDPVIATNSLKAFGTGRYSYRDAYGFGEKPTLIKNYELANAE